MKTLQIALAFAASLLLAGTVNAQSDNGRAVGKPERVRQMQEQKRQEHANRKAAKTVKHNEPGKAEKPEARPTATGKTKKIKRGLTGATAQHKPVKKQRIYRTGPSEKVHKEPARD